MVQPQGRVINGHDAPQGAWPWQVGLYDGDDSLGFFCGGSLIRDDWVLTAAHCINLETTPLKNFSVRLGDSHRYFNDHTEQIRRAVKVIVHPSFNYPVPLNNDVALIKLDRPVKLDYYVNTICLPTRMVDVALGSKCFISGTTVCTTRVVKC